MPPTLSLLLELAGLRRKGSGREVVHPGPPAGEAHG